MYRNMQLYYNHINDKIEQRCFPPFQMQCSVFINRGQYYSVVFISAFLADLVCGPVGLAVLPLQLCDIVKYELFRKRNVSVSTLCLCMWQQRSLFTSPHVFVELSGSWEGWVAMDRLSFEVRAFSHNNNNNFVLQCY